MNRAMKKYEDINFELFISKFDESKFNQLGK